MTSTPCTNKIRDRLAKMVETQAVLPEGAECLLDFLSGYEDLARVRPKAPDWLVEYMWRRTKQVVRGALQLEIEFTAENETGDPFAEALQALRPPYNRAQLSGFVEACRRFSQRMEFMRGVEALEMQVATASTRLDKVLAIDAFAHAVHGGGGPLLVHGCPGSGWEADELVTEVLNCLAGREGRG